MLNWLFFPYDYLFLSLSAYILGHATAITLQGAAVGQCCLPRQCLLLPSSRDHAGPFLPPACHAALWEMQTGVRRGVSAFASCPRFSLR